MGDERGEARTPVPGVSEDKRPSGLPPAESTARRVDGKKKSRGKSKGKAERRDPTPVTRLRPPGREGESGEGSEQRPPSPSPSREREGGQAQPSPSPSREREGGRASPPGEREGGQAEGEKQPVGLKNMTTSARLRLQLALDEDDDESLPPPAPKKPTGLTDMTPSARLRLQLALDEDVDEMEAIRPPRLPERVSMPEPGRIPFDADARKVVGSLSRWVAFCGLLTLAVGALTGLSYLTGPGSVAHVVVGILATALSVWLLAAAWSFRRVLTQKRQQHHLVNGLGLLRSALLLKAILLFSAMVLGCFTFSIATALLFLL